jgi:hypothetical protein
VGSRGGKLGGRRQEGENKISNQEKRTKIGTFDGTSLAKPQTLMEQIL